MKSRAAIQDRSARRAAWLGVLLCLLLPTAQASPELASEMEGGSAAPHGDIGIGACQPCAPVAVTRLDTMRGGLRIGNGLEASIGIERLVLINGRAVVEHRVHIPDLRQAGADSLLKLRDALAGVTVLNDASGGAVIRAASAGGTAVLGPTVIVNSLDGQSIRSLTTLEAGSNSMGSFKSGAVNATLRDALVLPLVPR